MLCFCGSNYEISKVRGRYAVAKSPRIPVSDTQTRHFASYISISSDVGIVTVTCLVESGPGHRTPTHLALWLARSTRLHQ